MILDNCCCCVYLRKGAIGVAVWGILAGCGLGLGAGEFVYYVTNSLVLLFGLGISSVVSCVCLLYGSIKYHQLTTLIYLVGSMIANVCYGINSILLFVHPLRCLSQSEHDARIPENYTSSITPWAYPVCGEVPNGVMVTIGMLYFVCGLVNLYLWLCIFSFYKGLRSGFIYRQDASLIT